MSRRPGPSTIRTLAFRSAAVLLALAVACALSEIIYRAVRAVEARASRTDTPRFELYVIGGSTAAGYPFDARASFAALARRMLGGKIDGLPIRIISSAHPGDSIYPQAMALTKSLRGRDRRHPSAVLVYSGHNEAFTTTRPGPPARLLRWTEERLLHRSILYNALSPRLRRRFGWRGTRDLRHYGFYMRMAVEASLRSGAVPFLATVVGNTAGVEPSVAPRYPLAAAREALARTDALASSDRLGEALMHLRRSEKQLPALAALLRYRRARIHEALGEREEARRAFAHAWDAHHPLRWDMATSAQNGLLRKLAAEYDVPLVDAVRDFQDERGLPDPELFIDGHHPNLRGAVVLGRSFARALGKRFDTPFSPDAVDPKTLLKDDPETRERALVISSRWLLAGSVGHPSPRGRLDLAESLLRRAPAETPGPFCGRLGLAVIEAVRKQDWLVDPAAVRWMDEHGMFSLDPGAACDQLQALDAIVERLRAAGVSEERLAGLRAAGPAGRAFHHCR